MSKQPLSGEFMTDEDGDRVVAKGEFDQDAAFKYAMCQSCCLSISFPPLLLVLPCMIPAVKRQVRERELILT